MHTLSKNNGLVIKNKLFFSFFDMLQVSSTIRRHYISVAGSLYEQMLKEFADICVTIG